MRRYVTLVLAERIHEYQLCSAARKQWMNSRLRKLLTGIAFRQEYVCLPLEGLSSPLRIYATARDLTGVRDVTSLHVLVGYKPAIIVLPVAAGAGPPATDPELCLSFATGDFVLDSRWKDFPTS